MLKIFAILLITLHSSVLYADGTKPVSWDNLPGHIAGMQLDAPDNLMECPTDLNMNTPYTTVVQWIENTRYRWREYEVGDQMCIVMEVPDPGPLSLEHATVLLKASSLWIQPARVQPGARIADFSQVDFQTVVPPTQQEFAVLNTVPEYGAITSPIMKKTPDQWDAGPMDEIGTFQSIIGADDRVPVGDTTVYPFNTIAFLTTARHGSIYRGTAFLVSPYTALTSAHLVYDYDTGAWADEVKVFPGQYEIGYDQVVHPYGVKSAFQMITNNLYTIYGDWGYDFACVHFDSPVAGISTFMPLQFGYDMDNYDTILHSAGYPAVVHGYDSLHQWYDYDLSSYYTTDTVARYYIDVTTGSSGSPVWLFQQNSRYVVAITAATWPYGLPNGGPRLTKSNQDLIESWVSWTPPVITPIIDNGDTNFDPAFYLNKYPDLAAAGYTTANVQSHWDNNGIHEGRQGSEVFDVKFYLQKYPDLQLAYGTNYYAAHTHWQYNGIYEGRQGSVSFDAKVYLQRYPDLQQAFGNDYKAAALHYMNSGKEEGRNGAP